MSGLSQLFGSSSSTSIPGWVSDAAKNLYSNALNFYNTRMPTPPTAGQRVAPLNATQTSAIGAITDPNSDLWTSLNQTKSIESSIPTLTSVGNITDQAQGYMNPFEQEAINPAIADIQRQSDAAQQQIGRQSMSAGAFGDARQAIDEGELQRQTSTAIGDVSGQMRAGEWNQAVADAQQGTQAQITEGLQGSQEEQQQFLQGIMAQLGAGNLQQQYQQSVNDVRFQNYLMKSQNPYDKLAALMSVVSGIPYNRTTTTSSNPLSAISSLFGGILGGGQQSGSGAVA